MTQKLDANFGTKKWNRDLRPSFVLIPISVFVPACTAYCCGMHVGTRTENGTNTQLGRRHQKITQKNAENAK